MNSIILFLQKFNYNFNFWYMISSIFCVIILYEFLFKKEWQKLRIEKKVCYDNDDAIDLSKLLFFKNKLVMLLIIFIIVCLLNAFLMKETNFKATLSVAQKIRNVVPILMVYMSIAFIQNVTIADNTDKILDRFLLFFYKIKNETLDNMVVKEINHINKQNKKMIHKISQPHLGKKMTEEKLEHKLKNSYLKLLYILLVFSACDEFETKHKYEIKAYQSNTNKQKFLERVISIRESLIGNKPFNESEFQYLCTGILPEIGICYSDIYATIKRISQYGEKIIEYKVKSTDTYFLEKYIKNKEAKEELTKDLFDKEVEAAFAKNE